MWNSVFVHEKRIKIRKMKEKKALRTENHSDRIYSQKKKLMLENCAPRARREREWHTEHHKAGMEWMLENPMLCSMLPQCGFTVTEKMCEKCACAHPRGKLSIFSRKKNKTSTRKTQQEEFCVPFTMENIFITRSVVGRRKVLCE